MNNYIEMITGINPQSKDPLMAPAHGKPVLTAMDVMSALVGECSHFADLIISSAQDSPVPADSMHEIIDQTVEQFIKSKGRQRRYIQAKTLPRRKLRQVAEFAALLVHQQKLVKNIHVAWDSWQGKTSNYQFAKVEPVLNHMVEWIDGQVSFICHNAFKKVGFGE